MHVEAASPPARREWIAVSVVWIGLLTGIVIWLSASPPIVLRDELRVLQPWWLDGCVLIAILIGICALPRARMLPRGDAARVLGLMMLALCLTLFVAPRTSRIFYDEQIYQSIGQNMSDLRLAQVCNDGTVESGRLRCADGEYNKQPYAYPHLLSLAYRVVGVHEWVAFAVNAIAIALTVAAVCLVTFALFGDRIASLLAGLLLALMPQQIVWSATAAVEPTASLGAIVAVLAAAWYVTDGSALALGALAVSAAYAIQFRPESLLVLPIVAAVAWPRLRLDAQRPRGWWAAVLFVTLTSMHIAHLYAVRNVNWGTEGARFSLVYVANNFRTNARFYLADGRFPAAFSALAVCGLFGAYARRERMAMGTYFLLFFSVDLLFYAGSYDYGADVRYSLMTYPPLAVLGGLGAANVSRTLKRLIPGAPAAALIAVALTFQFLWYAPGVRSLPDQSWAARADVQFAKDFAAHLPMDSYVFTQDPGMFQVWGVSAGQMSRAVASPPYAAWLVRQHSGGVYVHWNFWCNVQDRAQPELCRKALALGPTTLVAERRDRDQRLAFYRLSNPP
ncbi:MAG TPA: glycosyltransferase family 39 protein [Vicinamibacterales bacterium]|jgi:4-amino-4-deoxy-L-arabinose transferase-like glycosyltransferase|nr:glycosyltransferase family 39 protein [Vicinamibacterales bacterium]